MTRKLYPSISNRIIDQTISLSTVIRFHFLNENCAYAVNKTFCEENCPIESENRNASL